MLENELQNQHNNHLKMAQYLNSDAIQKETLKLLKNQGQQPVANIPAQQQQANVQQANVQPQPPVAVQQAQVIQAPPQVAVNPLQVQAPKANVPKVKGKGKKKTVADVVRGENEMEQ